MSNLYKSLAIAVLATSSIVAYTNHTVLTLRSHGYNLPLSFTTFHELVNHNTEGCSGGSLEVTGFYQASNSAHKLGKYFGMNDHNQMLLGHQNWGADLTGADLDSAYIIHDAWANAGQNTIKFNPTSDSYGATFAYLHTLDKMAKGLYFSLVMPIVHIENNMHMKVGDGIGSAVRNNIINYFKGTFTGFNDPYPPTNADAQQVLTYAKIDRARSKIGVADLDIKFGYNFIEQSTDHLGINIAVTVPTGNKNNGEHVFQPIVGNGKHWALGGGFEGQVRLWEHNDQSIKLTGDIDYRYLFKNSDIRTLGLKKDDGTLREWGQYTLLGSASGVTGVTTLTPAANIITQECDVTPGSQLEGLVNFAYISGGFVFDVGYNLFWREREKVKTRQSIESNTYGVANRGLIASTTVSYVTVYSNAYRTTASAPFGTYSNTFDEGNLAAGNATAPQYWISTSNLSTEAAETPSILTNKVYASLGYSYKEWGTPLMLGIGGSYEFGSDNAAPDFWSVHGKLGIAF